LADPQLSIEIHTLPLKSYHGVICRLNDRWVVQLKDDDMPNEKRFTLFHETSHTLSHRNGIPVFKKRRIEQVSFNELLADHFSSCILLPREWIKDKWAGIEKLDRMAEIFAVPKSVMYIRQRQLGLI
jgi:Zn-dependent peptidase ImmA (M78 family)